MRSFQRSELATKQKSPLQENCDKGASLAFTTFLGA